MIGKRSSGTANLVDHEPASAFQARAKRCAVKYANIFYHTPFCVSPTPPNFRGSRQSLLPVRSTRHPLCEQVAKAEAVKQLALKTFTDNPALAVGGFGSQHPGGAQFAVGDGSVRFCTETIDPVLFLQLGHRADGQLTGGDW